ncbi:hypothetical protein B0H14DRAFT_2895701 [Mycena olivaceomarginata]|nr:hypothetical protein B0H14DRAFT_2895701 [Mycena olivaceomarginata]
MPQVLQFLLPLLPLFCPAGLFRHISDSIGRRAMHLLSTEVSTGPLRLSWIALFPLPSVPMFRWGLTGNLACENGI